MSNVDSENKLHEILQIDKNEFESMRLKNIAECDSDILLKSNEMKFLERSLKDLTEKISIRNQQLDRLFKEKQSLEKITLDDILKMNKKKDENVAE
jgi:hypothetical protein